MKRVSLQVDRCQFLVGDFDPRRRDPGVQFRTDLQAGLGCRVRDQVDDDLVAHERAARATAEGRFAPHLLPIRGQDKEGNDLIMDKDEGIRTDTSLEKLAGLEPAFIVGGTVTAGNSSPLNDGAAAAVDLLPERGRA